MLSEEDLDDILYFCRAGELEILENHLARLSDDNDASRQDIIFAAFDASSGNSMLHMAAANGHTDILQCIMNDLVGPSDLLIHPFVNARNSAGNTALHWACLNGHLPIVKILLGKGADTTIKNKAGHDAVYEAEVAGKEEVVRWLLVERKGLEVGANGSDGEEEGRADGMDGVEANGATEEGRGEVDKLEKGVQGMNVGEEKQG
ncbi:MAG: hypothetical protein M1836_000551 [Candelina mexicana]|nr:MAG: hypothetical protein M1836_000551 [Candelina mexicana]